MSKLKHTCPVATKYHCKWGEGNLFDLIAHMKKQHPLELAIIKILIDKFSQGLE
jgi:hypothetical protein